MYAHAVTRLGDDEPGASASWIGDASRDSFTKWVTAVHAKGGVTATYPYHGTLNVAAWTDILSGHDTFGAPCAVYPIARANQFDQDPDQVSSTPQGDFAYYLAPAYVIRWAMAQPSYLYDSMLDPVSMRSAGTDQSPPDPTTNWAAIAKWGIVALASVVALNVLQYVPKPRNWE
jgi:hypothetical protein